MTILALYSNKGGVGKTASAVNLSYLAAQSGYKTLVCDLDPQSSTTYYFRVKPKLERSPKKFAKGGKSVEASIKGTDYENLDLLPADFTHRNLDVAFDKMKHSKERLQKILDPLKEEYDIIFLDCPPTINLIAENIFNAVDTLLVPLIPSTLPARAYKQLLPFLEKTGYDLNQVYVFFSMVDRQNKMHRETGLEVFRVYDRVLKSPIPYLPQIEQMGAYREPVPAYAPNSLAARAYQNLWAEIQQKILA